MASITRPLYSASTSKHLRPFDSRRDLAGVADLIELCFVDTLDHDGKRYLSRMRSAAQSSNIMGFSGFGIEWSGTSLSGFVWEQDGRLVGNASLIPYQVKGRRYLLIANVAVHPDFRRQGIARSLTVRAMEYARQQGVPSVWLHVREDNEPAVRLYRSLSFFERARRTTWNFASETSVIPLAHGYSLKSPRSQDWQLQKTWLLANYPPELTWHLSLSNISLLRPNIWGSIYRFFMNTSIRQWAVYQNGRILASLFWQVTPGQANTLWLAAPPQGDELAVELLLNSTCHHLSSRRTLMLEYPARQYAQSFKGAGFQAQQTLIWMEALFSSTAT